MTRIMKIYWNNQLIQKILLMKQTLKLMIIIIFNNQNKIKKLYILKKNNIIKIKFVS